MSYNLDKMNYNNRKKFLSFNSFTIMVYKLRQ